MRLDIQRLYVKYIILHRPAADPAIAKLSLKSMAKECPLSNARSTGLDASRLEARVRGRLSLGCLSMARREQQPQQSAADYCSRPVTSGHRRAALGRRELDVT